MGRNMGDYEDMDIDEILGRFGGGNRRGQFRRKQPRRQDTTIDVFVNIEEIATGCEKKMKISRKLYKDDGSVTQEDKVLKIKIKPG